MNQKRYLLNLMTKTRLAKPRRLKMSTDYFQNCIHKFRKVIAKARSLQIWIKHPVHEGMCPDQLVIFIAQFYLIEYSIFDCFKLSISFQCIVLLDSNGDIQDLLVVILCL